MQDDLIERLEALHVWPQFVADDHADILSPRQSAGLYEVGNVAHEAASAGRADNARIAALEADNARLMGLVENLAGAEAAYRIAHDLHGGGSLQSGRAWDRMRRAGDEARATLAKIKEATDAE